MKRHLTSFLVVGALAVLCVWVARNTYWTDVQIPTPPKGEALTNPFYAAQRFVDALGARSAWHRSLTIPPSTSIIVLSSWQWNLSERRRVALEHWVESGGRLIVDRGLLGGRAEFEQWSGIARAQKQEVDREDNRQMPHPCDRFREERAGIPTDARLHWLCDFDANSSLITTRTATWSLRNADGAQVMRVDVGKGSVTVVNAKPFAERSLFDGDHGWLLVAATNLRRGDDIHFFSEESHPSLLALVWSSGSPTVVLVLVLIWLGLWRSSVRLGPLAPIPERARRSLAEQIRGTGRFAVRCGDSESLHAACVRALNEAAGRHIAAYSRLSPRERTASLARLTGVSQDALSEAIHHPGVRRSFELRETIELLETARRAVQTHARSRHGTT
jgi:hypothetical protein